MRTNGPTDAAQTDVRLRRRELQFRHLKRNLYFRRCAEAAKELPIFRQNVLILRAPSCGNASVADDAKSVATFRRSAAQCFYGVIVLTLVTFVCIRLNADLATTAFIYLAVIVLLSLIGSYFASVVLILIAVAGLAYFFPPPFEFCDRLAARYCAGDRLLTHLFLFSIAAFCYLH